MKKTQKIKMNKGESLRRFGRRAISGLLTCGMLLGAPVLLTGCGGDPSDTSNPSVTTPSSSVTTATTTTVAPPKVSSALEQLIEDVCGFENFDYDFLCIDANQAGNGSVLKLVGTATINGQENNTVLTYPITDEHRDKILEVEIKLDQQEEGIEFTEDYHYYNDISNKVTEAEVKDIVEEIASQEPEQITHCTTEQMMQFAIKNIFKQENGIVLTNFQATRFDGLHLFLTIDTYVCLNEKDENGNTKYLVATWEMHQTNSRAEKDEDGNYIIDFNVSITSLERKLVSNEQVFLSDEEILTRFKTMVIGGQSGGIKRDMYRSYENYKEYINWDWMTHTNDTGRF